MRRRGGEEVEGGEEVAGDKKSFFEGGRECGDGEGLERRAWSRRGGKRGGDGGGWWLREWSELDLRIGKG